MGEHIESIAKRSFYDRGLFDNQRLKVSLNVGNELNELIKRAFPMNFE